MSIQKKSLITTLKAAKKANVARDVAKDAKGEKVASMRLNGKTLGTFKANYKSID